MEVRKLNSVTVINAAEQIKSLIVGKAGETGRKDKFIHIRAESSRDRLPPTESQNEGQKKLFIALPV